MKKEERGRELIALWDERPEDQRTMNDVLSFYGWLAQNRQELLPPARYGDPYQTVKSVLRGKIRG